jgi:hypothetical protein
VGRALVILCAAACAAVAAPQARAYGWPLRPFNQPHPVRGYFNDPRITSETGGGTSAAFHFGIDISAPDMTPVYAVAAGQAIVRGNTVRVRAKGREFSYWHIFPSVYTGQRVALHQEVGQIVPGYLHVHFAEKLGAEFVNPLRKGALAPYYDHTRPVVSGVSFDEEGRVEEPQQVTGVVDLLVTAYDVPPLAPPDPWSVVRLSPALIRWRIVGPGFAYAPWQIAVDFRWSLLPQALFPLVYGPGTRQNRANRPGNYVYYLWHAWDSTSLADGTYTVEVAASDTRGNTGTLSVPFTVAN